MSPIVPPYRSPENLRAAISAVDVEHAPDLQPDYGNKGWTHCNLAAERICERLGCPLPKGLLANQQAIWLHGILGQEAGWAQCAESQGIELSRAGAPVVAIWFNPDGHGHVGVLTPAPAGSTECFVAAAGASNHSFIRRTGTFGRHLPLYFFHP